MSFTVSVCACPAICTSVFIGIVNFLVAETEDWEFLVALAEAFSSGEPEITFEVEKNTVEITAITNQSTGYCPEPESWVSVNEVRDQQLNYVPMLVLGESTEIHTYMKRLYEEKCSQILAFWCFS